MHRFRKIGPYLKSSLNNKFSYAFFTAFVLIGCIAYLSRAQECLVTDSDPIAPFHKTYYGLTKGAACKKARVMCSFYSRSPKNCVYR